MKIVFFIGSMHNGGAERVISILANHYAEKGCDVDIALLLDGKIGYDIDKRVKTVELFCSDGSYAKNIIPWLCKIRSYIKKSKPDRIISFIGRINVLVLAACTGLKIPITVSERSNPQYDGRSKTMLGICGHFYKKAKNVIFQTKFQASCFPGIAPKNGIVLPNPVRVNAQKKENDAISIVTAGRLNPLKNHEMLINSFADVCKRFPDATLTIYGEGRLRQKLTEHIGNMGLEKNVFLPGNVSDLHERIASATMFVMTSEYEGLSNALVEAMMIGLPCITTDYDGADEVISDGVDGLIVKRGDTEQLTNAMLTLLNDEGLRNSLSENAVKTSEKYRYEAVLKRWDEVIE